MAATTASPSLAAQPSPRLPLILLALAVPLLLGSWYARLAASDISGPLAIAANASSVAVLAPGTLYHLDADGVLQSVDNETVSDDARDGGLAFVGSSLLVSPGVDDDLLFCTDDECAPFSEDNWAPTGPVQVHFDGVRFWFSETDADRIQRYTTDGKRIDMPVSDLSSPGSLWTHDDLLYIANAGEQKVVRYVIHKRGIDEPETFATFSTGPRENPVDVPRRLMPDGNGGFHAIFSNATRTAAAFVNIDADGEVTPAEIDELVNPVSMAMLGDALLVLDEESMQVLSVAADGSTSVFGDEDFQLQLASDQALRYWLRVSVPVLFALGVLALAFGGSWLLSILTFRPTDPALNVTPDANGIIWLPAECDLAPKRLPRFLQIAAPMALVPAAAMMFTTPWPLAGICWAALFFGIAVLVPVVAAARAKLPKGERIGVRDRQLIFTHPELGLREFALPRVEWTESFLRPEPGLDIPLVRKGVPLYHASTVESVLLPRLNLMRKIEG